MYKKFLFLFAFVIVFLPNIVEAKTNTGINYDAHDKFNYFYEQKNNTPFYNFLTRQGDNLYSYFKVSDNKHISIFYSSNLNLENFIPSSLKNSYLKAKYVVIISSTSPSVTREGETYVFKYTTSSDSSFHFFDENANQLFYESFSIEYSISYKINGVDETSSSNFSYMISSFYLSPSFLTISPSEEIVVTDIINDGNRYLIDDNANYSSFLASIRKFFSFGGIADYTDVVNTDIAYFKLYPYVSNTIKVRSLRNLLSYGTTIKTPQGFEILSLDSDNYGYIFIPKDIENVDLNRKLYTSTNESIYTNKVSIWLNTYSLKDNKFKAPYDDTKLANLSYKYPFTLYNIDVSKKLKELDESYNLTDYAIALTLQNYKYKPNLYYNPDSYTVCSVTSTCSFTNPLTNNEVTLTEDDIYNILASNDSTGASVDIFTPADDQQEIAKDHSELYEYNEDGEIKGFNLVKILGQVGTFLTSFLSVITILFSYFSLFLGALPFEIQSLLYFLLVSTTIIIIYKLIRG